jgi:hypothetical protein
MSLQRRQLAPMVCNTESGLYKGNGDTDTDGTANKTRRRSLSLPEMEQLARALAMLRARTDFYREEQGPAIGVTARLFTRLWVAASVTTNRL